MVITQKSAATPILTQLLTALTLGILAGLGLILAINLGVSVAFSGRVYPGVSMQGIPLSGLTREETTVKITNTYNYPETGQVLLVYGDKSWLARPVELGIFLDAESSAKAAYAIGRRGSLIKVLAERLALMQGQVNAQPTFIYNQSVGLAYLINLSLQINQPMREASLALSGTEVIITNGQSGRALDIQSSLAAVSRQVELMQDGVVPLVVLESTPAILDVTAPGEMARVILSEPLQLTLPASLGETAGSWKIEPTALAKLLTIQRVDNENATELKVVASKPAMTAYLQSLQEKTNLSPENARFIFNDETLQLDLLTSAVIGRELNIEQSIGSIDQALASGTHTVELVFDQTNPVVIDSMTGADLGITGKVIEYTSYFRGSSPDRIQNIQTASLSFHGLLIPPGGVLSMSDVLGDISLDNGYAEALIILGDETIQGVGGGVCQVSTTLFRTVFFSGYPILERHAHAYRVGYYEQTSSGHNTDLAGLDATVFVPLVDFRFQNDTDDWLLMETYVSTLNWSLTWKFYSTPDNRVVDWETSGLKNIVDAKDPFYRENPELAEGTLKQVDWAVDGADVVVTRTVTRDGGLMYDDTFTTRYEPWRDIFEYGPGTKLPRN